MTTIRERNILEQRRSGSTLQEIADEHEITVGRVSQILKRSLASAVSDTEYLRELEGDRLDALLHAIWDLAMDGEQDAIDRVLKIMDRRAKLYGLDYSDKVAGEKLKVEADKVRLVALAFSTALDSVGLTEDQRQAATQVMLKELRASSDVTVEGEVIEDGRELI